MAVPSVNAITSTNRPMSRVRGSRQAARTPLPRPVPASAVGRPSAPAGRKRRAATPYRRTPRRREPQVYGDRHPARAAAAPSPPPATVPRLQAAWNRGMIVRPSRRSTAAASTFIATSQAARAVAEGEQAEPLQRDRTPGVHAQAGHVSPTATSRVDRPPPGPVRTGGATAPALDIARTAPADMASSTSPSRPALTPARRGPPGSGRTRWPPANPLSPKTTATPVRAASNRRTAWPAGSMCGSGSPSSLLPPAPARPRSPASRCPTGYRGRIPTVRRTAIHPARPRDPRRRGRLSGRRRPTGRWGRMPPRQPRSVPPRAAVS